MFGQAPVLAPIARSSDVEARIASVNEVGVAVLGAAGVFLAEEKKEESIGSKFL